MRQDVSGLISDWGVNCKIRRFSSTVSTAGHLSGTYISQTTEQCWVQPITSKEMRADVGVEEIDDFVMFQRYGGFAFKADDRIVPSTDTYEYDVVAVEGRETHIEVRLKKVKHQ